jgi:hypothetical protein
MAKVTSKKLKSGDSDHLYLRLILLTILIHKMIRRVKNISVLSIYNTNELKLIKKIGGIGIKNLVNNKLSFHNINNYCNNFVDISIINSRYYSTYKNINHSSSSEFDSTANLEHHDYTIRMPSVMNAKEGIIDKWIKKEGDEFNAGDPLCEVTLEDLTVAVEAPRAGVISEIIIHSGTSIKIDAPIATFVRDKDEYFSFVEEQRIAKQTADKIADISENNDDDNKNIDNSEIKLELLRVIRNLIQDGKIVKDSPFTKGLQYLARKEDKELISIFSASYEGKPCSSNNTFDIGFFIENANDIVNEYLSKTK